MIKSTITSESSEDKTTANIHCDSNPSTTILRRISNTTYVVKVHFSQTSKETLEDKLHRLIKSEVAKNA